MLGRFADPVIGFLRKEDGATAVEYAVMLALIIAVIITVSGIGSNTLTMYANPDLQKAAGPQGS